MHLAILMWIDIAFLLYNFNASDFFFGPILLVTFCCAFFNPVQRSPDAFLARLPAMAQLVGATSSPATGTWEEGEKGEDRGIKLGGVKILHFL